MRTDACSRNRDNSFPSIIELSLLENRIVGKRKEGVAEF